MKNRNNKITSVDKLASSLENSNYQKLQVLGLIFK